MSTPCPNCGATVTVEHLRNNPECSAVAGRLAGIYALSKRKDDVRTGKPTRGRVWKTCPHCQITLSARAMWLHNCGHKRTRRKTEK